MSENALVPVEPKRPPAVIKRQGQFKLVSEQIRFTSLDDVSERLPEFCARLSR